PQLTRGLERIDADVLPPQVLTARAVKRAVVAAAERDREFIAHLAAKRLLLGETDVVRVDRPSAAYEAGLRGNECEVGLVAKPARCVRCAPKTVTSTPPDECLRT